MRLSRVLLAGAAVAAAGIATSAFTASNDVPDSVAGYGQGLVTGAEIRTINYIANPADGTYLDAVEFVSKTNVTGMTMTMTLKLGAAEGVLGTEVGTPYSCEEKVGFGWEEVTPGEMTITCDTSGDNRKFEDFDGVGLTVLQ